jgi:dihydrofolate reductase
MRSSVYIATSLDGYIARADGRIDWLARVERDGEDYGYARFFDSVDVVVLGRKTYDTVLGFDVWPYVGKRCVVVTHAPPRPRRDETYFAGDATALHAALRRDGARRVYVDGGSVIQQWLAAGLVTDMTVSIVPIALGAGVPLFGPSSGEVALRLDACQAFPSGLVQVRYTLGDAPEATKAAG